MSILNIFIPKIIPTQLDPDRRYNPSDPKSVLYSNVFAKCALLNMKEYGERDFYHFVNWLAKRGYCNVIRFFLTWADDWNVYRKINTPHPLNWNTFQFDVETIDPLYKNTVLDRAEFVADTGIKLEIITKYNVHGWDAHWQNPRNSNGFRGSPFYWDRDYGLWEWESYAEAQPKDIPEYAHGEITEEKAWEWIRQFKANKEYDIWFISEMIKSIEARIGKRYIIGQNEVPMGHGQHQQMKQFIYTPLGIPKRRLITSPPGDFVLAGKAEGYMLDLHGIRTVEQYEKAKRQLLEAGITESVRINSDGYGPYWYQAPNESAEFAFKQYRDLVIEIFRNGDYPQGNGWFYGKGRCSFGQLKKEIEQPCATLQHQHKVIILGR